MAQRLCQLFGRTFFFGLMLVYCPAYGQLSAFVDMRFYYFNIHETYSARRLGLGGASIADSDDAMNVRLNPANSVGFSTPVIALSGLSDTRTVSYKNISVPWMEVDDLTFSADRFTLLAFVLPLRLGNRDVAMSLMKSGNLLPGFFTPFGNQLLWVNDSSVMTGVSGGLDSYTVNLSAVLLRTLHVGVNLNFLAGKFTWEYMQGRTFPRPLPFHIRLEEQYGGVNADLGVIYRLWTLQFGFVFHTSTKLKIKYRAQKFEPARSIHTYQMERPLPALFEMGLSWRPVKALMVNFDFGAQGKQDYVGAFPSLDGSFYPDTPYLENRLKDFRTRRIGVQYALSLRDLGIFFRSGFGSSFMPYANNVYQESLLYEIRSGSQVWQKHFGLGFGVKMGNFRIDWGYQSRAEVHKVELVEDVPNFQIDTYPPTYAEEQTRRTRMMALDFMIAFK